MSQMAGYVSAEVKDRDAGKLVGQASLLFFRNG
jgi:hypothetical protein